MLEVYRIGKSCVRDYIWTTVENGNDDDDGDGDNEMQGILICVCTVYGFI